MSKIVCSGATGKCSVGSTISKLSVIASSIKINGSSIASKASSFEPFGFCSIKGGPCMPHLLNWQSTCNKIKINNEEVLTEKSIIYCSVGGCINFLETGQGLVEVKDD